MRPLLLLACAAAAAITDAAKVDSITTSVTSDGYVFVRVDAGGHSGWGQASYNNEHADLQDVIGAKVHEWVGPQVLGQEFTSPADIDAFAQGTWDQIYKHTGDVLAQALAGVDTALWDLVARSQNASVCTLIAREFNTTCKTRVSVYGSNGDRHKKPKDIVANAVHNRDTYGVQAFKFQIANRLGAHTGHDIDIKPGRTEALIPLARQMLGPDVMLMVDANGGFDNVTHATCIGELLVAHNYTWFEEPFPFWRYEDTTELMRAVPGLAVALGEQEYRLDVWSRNVGASMRYAQPDIHYVGGLSRALRVARMTIAAGVTFVPHSPNPSMLDVFALHLMASVPNAFGHMEFDAVNTRHPPSGTAFFVEPVYALEDGQMRVPLGPGWGVTLKPGLLANATNQTSTDDDRPGAQAAGRLRRRRMIWEEDVREG